jgi:hypothetical protein
MEEISILQRCYDPFVFMVPPFMVQVVVVDCVRCNKWPIWFGNKNFYRMIPTIRMWIPIQMLRWWMLVVYTLPPNVTFATQEPSHNMDAQVTRESSNLATSTATTAMPHDDTDHVEHHHTNHNDAGTKVPLGCETNILAE